MKKILLIFGLSLFLTSCGTPTAQSASTSHSASAEQTPNSGSETSDSSLAVDTSSKASTANNSPASETGVYREMDQQEAMQLLQENANLILLDVRTPSEYADGHIPNSVNLPNEDITTQEPELLPDRDQLILVYCRSGNRSGQAAKKLIGMGYTNVYNIGGINTWPGEIVK